MATARETIRTALRKLTVLGRGQTPDAAMLTDHLSDLNAMLRELADDGGAWPLQDVRVSASYEVPITYPGVRVQCAVGGLTITLPKGDMPSYPVPDGMRVSVVDVSNTFDTSNATLSRNGWKIEGAAANLTLSTEALSRVWMFRSDLGDWKRVADITVDQDLPYPTDFDLGIALMLARRLEGEYRMQLAPTDARAATRARIRLGARYVKPVTASFDGGASRLGANVRFEYETDVTNG